MYERHELQLAATHEPDEFDLNDEQGEEMLLARIPLLSGNASKARYLSWKASGFSVRESARAAEVTQATVMRWRKTDDNFRELEITYVRDLKRNLAADLLKLEFLRNMKMAMFKDSRVLQKAMGPLELMTERDFDYLKRIRPLYVASELLNLDRALAPEYEGAEETRVHATLTVTVDKKDVDSEEARRAAARKLLDQFTVNTQINVQVTAQQTNRETFDGDGYQD